ncbi:MAG TPA: hypothetical protein VGS13_15820 [Stellaceae bacterium]|nr:hypothetical protein [Stellaceae bacterium]
MTLSRKGSRYLAILALPAFAAACQPLPHPFAGDRPPAALLRVRDVAGVWIAPIEGSPPALADKLTAAMAKALLKHDIPASDKTTSLGSYQLYGRVAEAPTRQRSATVTAYWRLYNAKGGTVGEHSAKVEADAAALEAGDTNAVERLAASSADGLAPMLEEEAPVEAAESGESRRTRIAIGDIKGAPGDGATSLANAVAAVLKRQDLTIVEKGQPADLTIDGEVTVTPSKPHQQHVKIVWHVERAGGGEIGTVGQENDVPGGLLDGPWGDLAYNVAIAAGDGLMQLVARGAPEPKS